MNKSILVLVFVFLTSGVFAQLTFGPKLGYSSAKLSLDRSDITSELKNNFQFGVFVRIGTKIYVQPELNYVTLGSIYKTPEGSVMPAFEQEVKLKTIQVPILVGAKLINLKLFNFRVFGGPTASFVTKTKINNKLASAVEPIKDADLEDIIWSVQVGAGIDIAKITLDIRYNFGINKVIENINIPGIADPVEFSSKTSGFNVTLGFKFL